MEISAIYNSCCHLLFRLEFLNNSIGILTKYRPEKLKEKHQIEVADDYDFSTFQIGILQVVFFTSSDLKSRWLQLVYTN